MARKALAVAPVSSRDRWSMTLRRIALGTRAGNGGHLRQRRGNTTGDPTDQHHGHHEPDDGYPAKQRSEPRRACLGGGGRRWQATCSTGWLCASRNDLALTKNVSHLCTCSAVASGGSKANKATSKGGRATDESEELTTRCSLTKDASVLVTARMRLAMPRPDTGRLVIRRREHQEDQGAPCG